MANEPDARRAAAEWERVQRIFHAALAQPAVRRAAFVREACEGDDGLRASVEELLDADARGHALLDGGLASAATRVLGGAAGAEKDLPRQEFGHYRIVGVLGEGGMGVVYRAVRADLDSEAAIKVLRDAALSPARRERFAFEQRVLAQLDHPAIARLYDADTLPDGTPWFAMEVVDGVPITRHCRDAELSTEARLRLFREVCEAVQHAHGHAILHRDLKPSNILVRPDGQVKLLDFGIAKSLDATVGPIDATRTGLRLMTPAYAAPEQVRGGPLGVATDVYSLGVLLYELLTGQLPFDLDGRTPSEVADVLTRATARRPSTLAADRRNAPPGSAPGRAAWADLDVLCATAMHRDPARRYRTVDALARDVDRYLANQPLEARGDSVRYRTSKFVRRNARAVGAVVAGLVVVVSLTVFYTLRLQSARLAAEAQAARTQRLQRFMTELFAGEAPDEDSDVPPADTLRVLTLLGRGAQEAAGLSADPDMQAELERTLGNIYRGLGSFARADTLLAHALDHSLRRPHPDDAAIASDLAALAELRADESRFDDAERLARRAVDLAGRRLPARHRVLAEVTGSLGRVLSNRGDNAAALPVLLEAERLLTLSGAPASDHAATLTDLANADYYLGRLAEADSINRRLLALSATTYGPHHADAIDYLLNLAAIRTQRGRYAEAERFAREALVTARAWYGPDSPRTADIGTHLARALILEERFAEAESLLRASLRIESKAFGPTHPLVAGTLNELGNLALSRGRPDEAIDDFRRVVDSYRRAYGEHHGSLGVAIANLGSVYLQAHDDRRAEGCFRDALEAYRGALADDDVNVGISRIKLGRALTRQRRFAEGERETLAGYRILDARTEPSTSFLRAARTDLVADYEAMGRTADAARFRAALADTATRH